MSENLIESRIIPREDLYYPVTKDELRNLSRENRRGDGLSFIASLCLSSLIACILTLVVNENLKLWQSPELIILVTISSVGLIFSAYYAFDSKRYQWRFINQKISEEKSGFSIQSFRERSNPEYFTGSKHFSMNISVDQKEEFFKLLGATKEFSGILHSHHNNKNKTRFFTFTIKNGNDRLFKDFREFLVSNGIKYDDYK